MSKVSCPQQQQQQHEILCCVDNSSDPTKICLTFKGTPTAPLGHVSLSCFIDYLV